MRPYLAVISDSFRAAFSSRVLWVALVAIYVFLFAVAPIGYREVYTTTIRWFDIPNGTRLKAMLARDINQLAEGTAAKPTPSGMIARAMPEEIQNNLRKVAEGEEIRIQLDLLADALNDLLDRDDWYDADVWRNTNPIRELRELNEQDEGQLSDQLKQRRARLRIEAALPGVFGSRSPRSIAMTYAGFDFPAFFQIDPAQFKLLLNHVVLRIIIDWILGFAMIFLGILVTASIIPDMLQPGSLHLLLSKPVSRSWLYIAKFIGGCAFVLVCATQLIIGLWLICGFRLGVWNERLLLCIPVCVFLFAVFYSVSAVAGLRWRSPILSIGIANAFGAVCLLIGIAGGVSDGFITDPDRIESLAISGDTLIASTRGSNLRRFDRSSNAWVDLFDKENGRGDRILAPVTLSDGRIATARVRGGRMNMFGSGATNLLLLDVGDDWKPQLSVELPTATSQLIATKKNELIAINSSELMLRDMGLLNDSPSSKPMSEGQPATGDKDKKAGDMSANWLPKLLKMMGGATEGFRSIAPRELVLSTPRSISFSNDGDWAFVYSSGRLVRLIRPRQSDPSNAEAETSWRIDHSVSIDASGKAMWVRAIGDEVAVLQSEKPPLFFSEKLTPIEQKQPIEFDFSSLEISQVVSCGDTGMLVILSIDGTAYVLDRRRPESVLMSPIPGIAGADTAVWDDTAGRIWLSHQVDRVSSVDLSNQTVVEHLRPNVTGWRLVDKYLMTPLRTVTPQTSELGETIASIVSGESTMQFPVDTESAQVERYDVWRPVITCAVFIMAMLSLGCIYFSKADF